MTSVHQSAAWFRVSRIARQRLSAEIEAGHATCVDCGRAVLPGQRWQVGHIMAASLHPELALEQSNLGASHTKCNQSAGGKLGATKTNRARKRAQTGEYPEW